MTTTTTGGWRVLASQLARFGAVGAVGFLVDVGVFNLLRATVLSPEEVHTGPLIAKVISTVLAIFVNWMGNRYWTFSDRRSTSTAREGIEFFVVSIIGMVIGLACLWLSHYVLGFTSVLADNISSNVIGLALGAAFRFVAYRLWVFAPHRTASTTVALLPAAPDDGLVGER
ncbi:MULTISPECIES: GtrA family protein [unclassified Leifsonia]|uniref:GtrA family protein n=1 Tax=unclassified Leifsonia TaxID=2663824 RepID=UPI0006F96CFD|nr:MULTISPECIES: GtrA family protein [unclassified Leifsonia]KQX06372.1 GtrA family protein [Leifsonia sp. Root1293]KRA10656.1 GtrA family protein [Leifsonia sp. Root60]